MPKRKKQTKKRQLTAEERQLKKHLKKTHRLLIPINVQAVLGNTEWGRNRKYRPREYQNILVDAITRSSRAKEITELSRYILDTAPTVRLHLIHQAFVCATTDLPVDDCRYDNPIEFITEVIQWYERETRPTPLPPPDDGPKRDAMAASIRVA